MRETIMTLLLIGVFYVCVAKGLELWENLKSTYEEINEDKEV
jgi:site-specific recombinase